MTARRWCFTLNNPQDAFRGPINLQTIGGSAKYIIAQLERGESGTEHLQGYVEFKQSIRLAAAKKLLPTAHWEIAKGSKEQCKEYCSKQETRLSGPWEDGITELSILEEIKGMSEDDLLTYCIGKRISAGYFNELRKRTGNCIRDVPEIESGSEERLCSELIGREIQQSKSNVIIGPSGIGKTTFARLQITRPALWVTHLDDLRYLSPRHKGIIFDDMSFTHLPRTTQIYLVDSDMPRSIHIRYGTAFIPENITKIFTSNDEPFITDTAIERRINRIII